MDEASARAVALVRAIETADGAREVWTDADRAWAGRAAAESVGAEAADDAFVAQRAALSLQRLAERYPAFASLARRSAAWRRLGPLAAMAAFVVGAAGADIGPAHRINLLAPPVLALLAWNLLVYAMLIAAALRARGAAGARHPLRDAVARWSTRTTWRARASNAPAALAGALAHFASEWSRLAAPLWRQRATRLLHVCAASLAAGAIAGLYVRGIALEYRAGWQSTFLDAGAVARVLRVVLAPGAWLTGIALPDAARLERLGGASAGENAAPWIHLYAASVLLIVIAPRLALAAAAGLRERRLAARFPIALDGAYFQRLLRGWREGTARIAVISYSYTLAPASAEGLADVMARVFPSAVDIGWLPPVAYGADAIPELPAAPLAAIAAVFNASATPERENHGAFVAALAAHSAGRAPLIVVVDTSDFMQRFGDQPARVAERETAWQRMLADYGCDAVFARLAEPQLTEAVRDVTARLERIAS